MGLFGLSQQEKNDKLITFAEKGDFVICKKLIKKGADVNAKYAIQTALHQASQCGHTEIVKLLIEKGANINTKDFHGETALMGASKVEIAKLLIDKGADVNAKCDVGWTALMFATTTGSFAVAEILVDNGANVNARSDMGVIPLCRALSKRARNDDEELIKYKFVKSLIEKGADVNVKDENGETALIFALKELGIEYVKLLIENGADVNAKNKHGHDAWDFFTENEEKSRLLIENGIDSILKSNRAGELLVSTVNISGRIQSFKDVAKLLMEKGVDVKSARDSNGNTALMATDNFKEMKEFIDKGVDVNAKNKEGKTALMMKASYQHEGIVNFLIEKGADVNAKDDGGRTALMNASEKGETKVIQLLIDKGAYVNAKTVIGETALFLSAINEHWEVYRYLIKEGADANHTLFLLKGKLEEAFVYNPAYSEDGQREWIIKLKEIIKTAEMLSNIGQY